MTTKLTITKAVDTDFQIEKKFYWYILKNLLGKAGRNDEKAYRERC